MKRVNKAVVTVVILIMCFSGSAASSMDVGVNSFGEMLITGSLFPGQSDFSDPFLLEGPGGVLVELEWEPSCSSLQVRLYCFQCEDIIDCEGVSGGRGLVSFDNVAPGFYAISICNSSQLEVEYWGKVIWMW